MPWLLFLPVVAAHFVVDWNSGMFPMYKARMNLDISESAVWATVAGVLSCICQPIFGILADRNSPKLWIVIGLLLTISTTLAISCVTDLTVIGLLLLIQGLGISTFHPAGAGWVGKAAHRERQNIVISLFIMCGTIGFACSHFSVTLSFELTEGLLGWGTAFLLPMTAISTLILIYVAAARPTAAVNGRASSIRETWNTLARNRGPLIVSLVLSFVVSAMQVGTYFVLPEMLRERGYPSYVSDGGIYFAFVIGSALVMVPAGFLSDRIGRRRVAVLAFLLAIPLDALFIFGGRIPEVLLFPLCFLIGGTIGAVGPLAIASAHDALPHENLSLASAISMGVAWAFAAAIRVPMAILSEQWSFTDAYLALGVLLPIGLIFSFALRKRGSAIIPESPLSP